MSTASTARRAVVSLPWWADLLGIFSFGVFIYEVHHSLVPLIEPDAAISSSPTDLPMTARNPSEFFDLNDVQFFCHLAEQRFERDKSQTVGRPFYRIIGLVEWPIRQPVFTITLGEIVSFPCNIVENSTMKLDGVPAQTIRLQHKSWSFSMASGSEIPNIYLEESF